VKSELRVARVVGQSQSFGAIFRARPLPDQKTFSVREFWGRGQTGVVHAREPTSPYDVRGSVPSSTTRKRPAEASIDLVPRSDPDPAEGEQG